MIKLKNLLNEAILSPKECERYSYQIAKAYADYFYSDNEKSDKAYSKYDALVKKSKIPHDKEAKIQHHVAQTKGNFRPIDVYQYW